jgi:iron complex outermembrane recepter protein
MNRIYLLVLFVFVALNAAFSQTSMLSAPNVATGVPGSEKETGAVQGRILTTDQQPASWVSVILRDANRSTLTNENGIYVLKNIKPGQYTLVVSMTGLQSKEQQVTVKPNEVTEANFTLSENHKQLEEVVVTSLKV